MRLSRLPPRGVEGWGGYLVNMLRSLSLQERTVLQVLIFVISTVGSGVGQVVGFGFSTRASKNIYFRSLKLVCANCGFNLKWKFKRVYDRLVII